MRSLARLTFIISLLATPAMAFAAQETVWDFTGGKQPGQWSGTPGMEASATSEGLLLRAVNESAFFGKVAEHAVDAIIFTLESATDTDAMLLWRSAGMQQGFRQMPLQLKSGEQTIALGTSTMPGWARKPEAVGIALPGGATVVIRSIRSEGLSLPERVAEAWKTFWMFDTFGTYSVNFLWGPLVTFDPLSRAQLYEHQPPMALSANRYFYILIALAGIILFALARWKKYRNALPVFLGITAMLWVFYDLRMGAEYLSYALTDYRSYISQPAEKKRFRQYENFYAAAEQAVPLLRQDESYTVIPPAQSQVEQILQYETYPSIPARTDEQKLASRLWFVFRRPDVRVSSGGLVANGQPMTPPGEVLQRYDDSSFLYRVNDR